MSQQRTDNLQMLAAGNAYAGEGMPQVMDMHVRQSSAFAYLSPRVFDVHKVAAFLAATDNEGIVLYPGNIIQNLQGRGGYPKLVSTMMRLIW